MQPLGLLRGSYTHCAPAGASTHPSKNSPKEWYTVWFNTEFRAVAHSSIHIPVKLCDNDAGNI